MSFTAFGRALALILIVFGLFQYILGTGAEAGRLATQNAAGLLGLQSASTAFRGEDLKILAGVLLGLLVETRHRVLRAV